MSRRQKAIDILKKYQDKLVERLTDLVIEQEDQLMQEADGFDMGFTNDLYDLAEKLRAVAVTLSVIPSEQKPETDYQDNQHVVVITAMPNITINDFLSSIEMDDIEGGARALAHLFGLTFDEAVKCTEHFVNKLETDENTMSKLTQLSTTISCSMNETIRLMADLFGLVPPVAQRVIYHILDLAQ